MQEDIIFEALIEWNKWGKEREKLKKRETMPLIPSANVCLVIKGIRRSGKSSLAYLLSDRFPNKDTLIINFEDPRMSDIDSRDIFKVIGIYQRHINTEGPRLLILDEVQIIKGWERVVRTSIDNKRSKIVVTGSSSKLMSEEYASVLTGRHIDFELLPLSFREVLMWERIKIDMINLYRNKPRIFNILEDYIKFGGFPEVYKSHEKTELLRSYFDDILIKDVVKRYRIKEIYKLEEVARLYLSNISSLQSFNKLKNIMKISLDTVERFSKYLEVARLFLFIKKFSFSVGEQMLNPKKVYAIDTGFFNALGFKVSQNIGRLMENLVAIELARRASYYDRELEIYYFKDTQQHEVDFLIKKGARIAQLMQVTHASSLDEINPREIRSLLKAKDLFKQHRPELTVITWDYEDEKQVEWWRKKGRIRFVPLWKWLLDI